MEDEADFFCNIITKNRDLSYADACVSTQVASRDTPAKTCSLQAALSSGSMISAG